MDIKIDEVYTLKGKGELKFSIYEERVTKEKIVKEGKVRKRILLDESEQVSFSELVASNLPIEECIKKLIAFKIKRSEAVVSLEEFLEIYIKEKGKFEEAINKVLDIKV